VSPLHINTPLLAAPLDLFGNPPDQTFWLKMDALQPGGSFKLRGVGKLVQQRVAEGAQAVVCASGGNAGMAATVAALAMGVPVTIVLPQTTSQAVQQLLAKCGAQVVVHGAVWDESHRHALALADAQQAAYIHPFDNELLWQGHATLIDEVVQSGVVFDAVVTSVGGGGLFSGIVAGLRRNQLSHVPVVAVETTGSASLHASLQAGAWLTLPVVTSIATSLNARQVAQQAFVLAREHPTHSVLVSDAQAVAACLHFADVMRLLVEPACGAALAAVTAHPELFAQFKSPLIEVCGGVGVSLERLRAWHADFAA
jgi:L-serine/L-threonine ammonia-lyase